MVKRPAAAGRALDPAPVELGRSSRRGRGRGILDHRQKGRSAGSGDRVLRGVVMRRSFSGDRAVDAQHERLIIREGLTGLFAARKAGAVVPADLLLPALQGQDE
jgi:hypothetical protein